MNDATRSQQMPPDRYSAFRRMCWCYQDINGYEASTSTKFTLKCASCGMGQTSTLQRLFELGWRPGRIGSFWQCPYCSGKKQREKKKKRKADSSVRWDHFYPECPECGSLKVANQQEETRLLVYLKRCQACGARWDIVDSSDPPKWLISPSDFGQQLSDGFEMMFMTARGATID